MVKFASSFQQFITCSRLLTKKSPFHINVNKWEKFSLKQLNSRSICTSRIHGVRYIPNKTSWTAAEQDRKGGAGRVIPDNDKLVLGLQDLKNDFKLLKQEVKRHFTEDALELKPGYLDKVFVFDSTASKISNGAFSTKPLDSPHYLCPLLDVNEHHDLEATRSDFDSWRVSTDTDSDIGRSTAQFRASPAGHALFTGDLCMEPVDPGLASRVGVVNVSCLRTKKAFNRRDFFNWTDYSHLVIRCRGDGRVYRLNLHCGGEFDLTWFNIWFYRLYTRGGPHWQTFIVPFSRFYKTAKGRVQDNQQEVLQSEIEYFSIGLSDQVGGPFQLEIDYIGVLYDPTHKEQFAYETYVCTKIFY